MRNINTHKKLIILFSVGVFCLFYSCKTNQISKNETKAENLAILDKLYNRDNYRVAIEVAYPFNSVATTQVFNTLLRNTGNNASRIDVTGDGNFIEIQNDSVKGYLSFFGERRLNAGNYGSNNTAIQFEEPLQDLTKKINTDKNNLELKFSAHQKGTDNENYQVNLKIFPNKYVNVNITPVYKTFIRYSGTLEPVDENQ